MGLLRNFMTVLFCIIKKEILVLNLIIFVPVQSLYKHLY